MEKPKQTQKNGSVFNKTDQFLIFFSLKFQKSNFGSVLSVFSEINKTSPVFGALQGAALIQI
jgi:hypothetical protein